jgi:hypothetical protein
MDRGSSRISVALGKAVSALTVGSINAGVSENATYVIPNYIFNVTFLAEQACLRWGVREGAH